MRQDLEPIQIKEPPLNELKKKKSCVKRSCFSGCGCITVFIIISLLIIKLTTGPNEKELKEIPTNFPNDIEVYDSDNIDKISIILGSEKNRGLEIVAYLPKLILSPAIIAIQKNLGNDSALEEGKLWQQIYQIVKEPVTDHRDTIKI